MRSIDYRINETSMAAVRMLKLPFRAMEDTLGDGNCFFRAICHQLSLIGIYYHHRELRRDVIMFIAKNEKLHKNDTFQAAKLCWIDDHSRTPPSEEAGETLWKQFLVYCLRPGVWAQDIIVDATALYLEMDIFICSTQNTKKQPWTVVPGGEKAEKKKPLTLAYIPRTHFQTISQDPRLEWNLDRCSACGRRITSIRHHLKRKKKRLCFRFYTDEKLAQIREIENAWTRSVNNNNRNNEENDNSNEEEIIITNNNSDNSSEIRITEFDFVDVNNSASASTLDSAEDENVERKNKNNKTGKKNPKRRKSGEAFGYENGYESPPKYGKFDNTPTASSMLGSGLNCEVNPALPSIMIPYAKE